ncbi:MAG: DUF3365 domain-containing protein [Opitutaceae bacterium]|nr:DUF3365 domain-containing protein [Opitutaceae bacterium]
MAITAIVPRGGVGADPAAVKGLEVQLTDPLIHPQAAQVHRLAAAATNFLGQRLVGEINAALKSGSPEDAVALAHLRRLSTDGKALPGMPAITAFKLTSRRVLNVANSPDFAEEQVLEEIERRLRASSKPPDVLVQHITRPDGTEEWRGYRPLGLLPMCVACHGPTETQSPRLRTLLIERAGPQPAVDYKPGEWRGVLRVTVEPPPEA